MKTFFAKTVLLWPVLLIITCLVAVGALGGMRALLSIFPSATDSEDRNTQVVTSITRQEKVVLLSLGIEGIKEKKEPIASFLGMNVPGSERATFVKYAFKSTLGIDGKDVRIAQTGENEFLVTIPDFVFIGHDNESFEVLNENNGVLSWMTPRIDAVEMVDNILNDDGATAQYIKANQAILRDQATAFYTGIITGIDSTVDVEFDFRN